MKPDMVRNRKPYLQHERTRHGAWVWYFRKDKHSKRTRYGSEQFNREYDLALQGLPVERNHLKTPTGSLGWLLCCQCETPLKEFF